LQGDGELDGRGADPMHNPPPFASGLGPAMAEFSLVWSHITNPIQSRYINTDEFNWFEHKVINMSSYYYINIQVLKIKLSWNTQINI